MTGKNKEMNYNVFKGIRISEEQEKKWDPKLIRKFLNNGSSSNTELLDKLVLLMIKAGVNSSKYNIDIKESEIEDSIKRLNEEGKL